MPQRRVLNGDIGFVTSDHSPCTPDLKATDNAFEAWGGIAGLQNNVDVLYDDQDVIFHGLVENILLQDQYHLTPLYRSKGNVYMFHR